MYTDSAYGHGAVRVDGPQWVKRNFLMTANIPVKHRVHLEKLIHAVSLTLAVAVMICKGHQKLDTRVAEGNNAANAVAKAAGGYTPKQMVLKETQLPELTEVCRNMQEPMNRVSGAEKEPLRRKVGSGELTMEG